MEQLILDAMERPAGKFREVGFVAGVVYGDGIENSTSVKFHEKELNSVISNNGKNAKIWININNSKKYGYIKDVQRKILTKELSHIDIQIVSIDHEIKRQIPIVYKGEDTLKINLLQLHVSKMDITVTGKMALIPDSIEVDLSEMKLGDNITISNFNLNKELKFENDDTIFATINHMKNIVEVETETEAE